MLDYQELMGELLELGVTANPVHPYTACIVDSTGQALVTACNAVHISPLFNAESLAIHILSQEFRCKPDQPLTLISTAEIDHSSLFAVYLAWWQDIHITQLISGCSRTDLDTIWPDFTGQPLVDALELYPSVFKESLTIQSNVLQEDCREVFADGYALEQEGKTPVLSKQLDQYWTAGDWLMDDR